MKRLSNVALLTLFVIVTAGRSLAADLTGAELMQAAIELGTVPTDDASPNLNRLNSLAFMSG